MKRQLLFYILIGLFTSVLASHYSLELTSNAPIVAGATATFVAKLFNDDRPAVGTFTFDWQDNALSRHKREFETDAPNDTWSVNYPVEISPPGPYEVEVVVYSKFMLIPYIITSKRLTFIITDTLNGEMQLVQYNKTIKSNFVSNTSEVVHGIVLKDADREYLNSTNAQVLTYWFIDCDYLGVTEDFKLAMNYSQTDVMHEIDAFVMADFSPVPTEPPATTTTTTTTTMTTTTTTSTTSTTPKPSTSMSTKSRQLRALQNVMNFRNASDIVYSRHHKYINATGQLNTSFPFICSNHTIIPVGPNMVYGYFSKSIVAKEPVSKISVQGNNWIQQSDVLKLTVSCNGSSSFQYCYMFKNGLYNVTGNETCVISDNMERCEFDIIRFFVQDIVNVHTIVIIIDNDVSSQIYPVTVTVYKVTKQAQLSVIMVPVGFSLVSIVLIIFGVAYYWQNSTRYTVEVADFNFGQQFGEMEYKTFSDRLKEALANAFTRAPTPSGSSEGGPVWPPGQQTGGKYDEMS